MAKQKMSGSAAVEDVLRKADGPLHVKEIAERVLAGYETGLKGKTPAATIAAKLHVQANKGETFVKVGKGTFDLIDRAGTSPAAADGEDSTPDEETERAAVAEATDEDETPAEPAGDLAENHSPIKGAVVLRRGEVKPEVKPDPKPEPKQKSTRTRGRAAVKA